MYREINRTQVPQDIAKDFKIAVVYASWHPEIIDKLIEGAKSTAIEANVPEENLQYFQVAGSYEIPQMVECLARSQTYAAIVPLGCVVQGRTNHFDLICNMLSTSLDQIGRKHAVAVSFGIVTAKDMDQAISRADGTKGNKGQEAMNAALSLAVSMKSAQ
ncbi:MAG: 6,7-dimethyl-8-ribityllumazine synthase [Bdellovibrionales bacterium]|nr:6,7-dimethyl-8-ribityllumazine synthase [Bdellovibrionales bacterium]